MLDAKNLSKSFHDGKYAKTILKDIHLHMVKSKLLCKFPFDRQHGPDDLTYGR